MKFTHPKTIQFKLILLLISALNLSACHDAHTDLDECLNDVTNEATTDIEKTLDAQTDTPETLTFACMTRKGWSHSEGTNDNEEGSYGRNIWHQIFSR